MRETLGAREKVSGSGRFLCDDGRIAGSPAFATPDALAATLFVGAFREAVLALFGPGVEARVDRQNNYNAGLIALVEPTLALGNQVPPCRRTRRPHCRHAVLRGDAGLVLINDSWPERLSAKSVVGRVVFPPGPS